MPQPSPSASMFTSLATLGYAGIIYLSMSPITFPFIGAERVGGYHHNVETLLSSKTHRLRRGTALDWTNPNWARPTTTLVA